MELFAVVDLSTVWVIGHVYERDRSRVRVGSSVSVTAAASPGRIWEGRVSYIDPQVAPETRTVPLRIEVPNRDEQLRLGMYVDVAIAGTDARHMVPLVSRSSVQTVGDRQFVYLPEPGRPGRFVEREVRLGSGTSGEEVEVLAGLNAGEVVVTKGGFLLRAERERLGLRRDASGRSRESRGNLGDSQSFQAAQPSVVRSRSPIMASRPTEWRSHAVQKSRSSSCVVRTRRARRSWRCLH
jgi:multidrug efflux pump subunit AcrA (membrane-fusion protein)